LGQQLFPCPPIRQIFPKLKTVGQNSLSFFAHSSAQTYPELDQSISDALATVATKEIIGWFTHCCCYISANWEPLQGKRILFLKGRLGKGFRHLIFIIIDS
jgi:hypothetical protein